MSFIDLSRYTNSGIKHQINLSIAALLLLCSTASYASTDDILRDSAKKNGLVPVNQLYKPTDSRLVSIGENFFSTRHLSNSGDIACLDCHLDEFSSADGLPNAVGVGGVGEGLKRALSGGEVIPRNTLPLWGRGQSGFNTFFWDGKVEYRNGQIASQFGEAAPSHDPLVVSVHLPVIEIREMLIETPVVAESKTETVTGADRVYKELISNVLEHEPDLMAQLASHLDKPIEDVTFADISVSIAEFIREKFRLKPTRFHEFVFRKGELSEQEKNGANIFYGKGKCSVCHSGAYLSDFNFHSIALPQIGFGKNGFGVDYGRYNVTHNPNDLYKFRTPPLYNVKATGPYGHSGSVATLRKAITFHFDPLAQIELSTMTTHDRTEYYKKMVSANEALILIASLSNQELSDVLKFLDTLSFD